MMNAALGIVIRTSVLLAFVSLLALVLRRASASVRHALWVVGLLAVLVFPVASRLLPEWNWAVLPAPAPAFTAFDTTPAPMPKLDPIPVLSGSPSQPSAPSRTRHAPVPLKAQPTPKWNWGQWTVLIWVLVSCAFVFGWLKSVWDLHRLAQHSESIVDEALSSRLLDAQREIGVSGTVRLRIAVEAIPPMTWGIFRHVILLPASAIHWTSTRQRLVLAHEMAHVKRNDGIGQLLAQAVCSIYWFNPMVWYAVRRLHVERERACDDSVLRLGADNADYADHLLQIARGLNSGFAQSAVSMAHPSQLKARVMAILDSRMRRSRASRMTATALLTTVSVLMLTIAAVQVTALSSMVLPAFASPLGVPLFGIPISSPTPAVQVRAATTPAPAAAIDPHYAFLNQYCVRCHNSNDRVANLVFDFEKLDSGGVADSRPKWEKVVRRLRAGMDPPLSDAVIRPSESEIKSMILFLETELDRNAKTYVPPIVPHRLNRTEYANAIRDLLDLEIDAEKLLPIDDSSSNFDNIAKNLTNSDAYVGIAPIVSRLAIQAGKNSLSYQKVFVCPSTSIYGDVSEPCARKIIGTLTDNAFRGFATSADVDSFVAILKARGFYNDGVTPALAQILSSPKFLFRTEDAPADVKPGEAYRISDLALASRLSFFLWSTIPDQELIDLAKQGKLHEPAVLEQQTLRMLKDYRAESLSQNFAGRWLTFRYLPNVNASPVFFPEFNDSLRQDMGREVQMLFDSIVREDRNVVDLLTANDTYVNSRLAHLYGIPNVSGSQFRRIALPTGLDARRGILGKAAFLSISSRIIRTSVVGRGKWIMGVLLGVPPPDPPPLETPIAARSNDPDVLEPSMRKAMESVKIAPACVACHRYTDPIGYSLENFNAIGVWRNADGGEPVDATDILFDGTKVHGPAGLRGWLVGKSDQFIQTMTVKLMTYALGRGVEPQDMPLIRAIDRDAARNNNRFSALVLGIVKSDTFQMNSK